MTDPLYSEFNYSLVRADPELLLFENQRSAQLASKKIDSEDLSLNSGKTE
jgi:hypothetical protein